MRRLTESSVINIKNKSHAITCEVETESAGARGVIVCQGGAFGGWAIYTAPGRISYCHNFLGLQRFAVHAEHGSRSSGEIRSADLLRRRDH
jgi:hypothetical protein